MALLRRRHCSLYIVNAARTRFAGAIYRAWTMPLLACLSLPPVDTFVDSLIELGTWEWLDIGNSLAADRNGSIARQAARSVVDAALDRHTLWLPAWHVRDAVDTAAFFGTRHVSEWSRERRRAAAAAHTAAESAALALLVAPLIQRDAVDCLCAPFPALPTSRSGTWITTESWDAWREAQRLTSAGPERRRTRTWA